MLISVNCGNLNCHCTSSESLSVGHKGALVTGVHCSGGS